MRHMHQNNLSKIVAPTTVPPSSPTLFLASCSPSSLLLLLCLSLIFFFLSIVSLSLFTVSSTDRCTCTDLSSISSFYTFPSISYNVLCTICVHWSNNVCTSTTFKRKKERKHFCDSFCFSCVVLWFQQAVSFNHSAKCGGGTIGPTCFQKGTVLFSHRGWRGGSRRIACMCIYVANASYGWCVVQLQRCKSCTPKNGHC